MVKIADFKKFVDGLLKPVNNKAGKVDARIKVWGRKRIVQ